jgi:4-hydroxy-L-threonine phosphate dehydrogenase PdxA
MPRSDQQGSMNPGDSRPLMALTLGDPSGIGPEIVLKAAADPETLRLGCFCGAGQPCLPEGEQAADRTGVPVR